MHVGGVPHHSQCPFLRLCEGVGSLLAFKYAHVCVCGVYLLSSMPLRACVYCMSIVPEDFHASATLHPARSGLLHLDDYGAVCTRAQLQLEVTLQRDKERRIYERLEQISRREQISEWIDQCPEQSSHVN